MASLSSWVCTAHCVVYCSSCRKCRFRSSWHRKNTSPQVLLVVAVLNLKLFHACVRQLLACQNKAHFPKRRRERTTRTRPNGADGPHDLSLLRLYSLIWMALKIISSVPDAESLLILHMASHSGPSCGQLPTRETYSETLQLQVRTQRRIDLGPRKA